MLNILEVKNLRKKYPDVIAVDGISFAVKKGICFGLLGPNGRRDRLIEAHDLGDPEFTARLHGPAGLSIGADSPETIAL